MSLYDEAFPNGEFGFDPTTVYSQLKSTVNTAQEAIAQGNIIFDAAKSAHGGYGVRAVRAQQAVSGQSKADAGDVAGKIGAGIASGIAIGTAVASATGLGLPFPSLSSERQSAPQSAPSSAPASPSPKTGTTSRDCSPARTTLRRRTTDSPATGRASFRLRTVRRSGSSPASCGGTRDALPTPSSTRRRTDRMPDLPVRSPLSLPGRA